MRFRRALPALFLALTPGALSAQTRSMAQDPSLDNLRLPPGAETTPLGKLGRVRRVGEGPKAMRLIPGLGFGGTPPLPMPEDPARFADMPWTRSSLQAIEALADQEHIEQVTNVAHWALASQIALRLALDHPDRVEAAVLVGGVLKSYYEGGPSDMRTWTLSSASASPTAWASAGSRP